jgi:hypothetical protein
MMQMTVAMDDALAQVAWRYHARIGGGTGSGAAP